MNDVWSKIRILIAEDDDGLREVLSEYFTEKGSQIWTASNGEEAWAILNYQDVDVLISDVRMPKLDGVHLLRRIVEGPGKPPIILMATGYSDYSRTEMMNLGAKDLLNKPFDLQSLERIILESYAKL